LLLVDWPLFGELSRALALKVARVYRPEIVVGIATAGVVPGAAVAAILDLPFHSILVSRRYSAETVRETPAVFGAAPADVRNKRVLVVDETCDSGAGRRGRWSARAPVKAHRRQPDGSAHFTHSRPAPSLWDRGL
jgi:hypothetical protein